MTSSERYRRALELFDQACDIPEAERTAFLDEACGDDADLRREVESLLVFDQTGAADVAADGAVGQALAANLSADALPTDPSALERLSDQIPGFRLTGVLGRGGMGVIYEAEQETPRREVALKVIRSGLLTEQVTRRFGHEVEILGKLKHPGIARIFEAGVTADEPASAQPFFAMELVRGEPLDRHAENEPLSLAERMELVARVCEAVQHAHQNGIIHRDLKPANVLVAQTDDRIGQPKVLDFGIARATDATPGGATVMTETGQLVGTLDYMSPEQLDGRSSDLDTRCDVYALGAILYELLVGGRPYDLHGLSIVEAVRRVLESDPARPGVANPALRGDAEAILERAMHKDREQRYASAAELAGDLRRSLRNETILARPATGAYYLRKFARRNRILVAAALTLIVALLGSATATTFGLLSALAANRELEDERVALGEAIVEEELRTGITEETVKFLNEDLLEAIRPSDVPGRGRDAAMPDVLAEAGRRLDEASAPGGRFADQPRIEASIRETIGSACATLGLYDEALRHLERAVQLLRSHVGDAHESTRAVRLKLDDLKK